MSHNFPSTIPIASIADLPPSTPAPIWIDSAPAPVSRAETPLPPIEFDVEYAPRSAEVMDIPAIDDPKFMPALAYWSKRLNCSVQNLAEAHARLGSAPSIKSILSTLDLIQSEEKNVKVTGASAHSSRVRRFGPPRFASTWSEN